MNPYPPFGAGASGGIRSEFAVNDCAALPALVWGISAVSQAHPTMVSAAWTPISSIGLCITANLRSTFSALVIFHGHDVFSPSALIFMDYILTAGKE